jgi:hypothetical protein
MAYAEFYPSKAAIKNKVKPRKVALSHCHEQELKSEAYRRHDWRGRVWQEGQFGVGGKGRLGWRQMGE